MAGKLTCHSPHIGENGRQIEQKSHSNELAECRGKKKDTVDY